MHAFDFGGASGNYRQFALEAFQVELADHTVMRLLDQKHARARLELILDESVFARRETEALGVFGEVGIGVREKYLCRRLFDESAADGTVEHIARTLRRQAHRGIQFSPGLWTVLGEGFESGIRQQAPKLIHPANEPAAVQ